MVSTTISTINPFLIGFESLFDKASKVMNESSYPPYNVIKYSKEQKEANEYNWDYEIHLAVAGFKDKEIQVYRQGNILTISGESKEEPEDGFTYLHKGISSRKFKKQFTLSDDIVVIDHGIGFNEGLMHICLEKLERKPDIEYYDIW